MTTFVIKAAIALLPLLFSASLTAPTLSAPKPSDSTPQFVPPVPPNPGEPSDRPQGGGTRLHLEDKILKPCGIFARTQITH